MKVIIRNSRGQYLTQRQGKPGFTSRRSLALIYDTDTDHVEEQIRQVSDEFGETWVAEPCEPVPTGATPT